MQWEANAPKRCMLKEQNGFNIFEFIHVLTNCLALHSKKSQCEEQIYCNFCILSKSKPKAIQFPLLLRKSLWMIVWAVGSWSHSLLCCRFLACPRPPSRKTHLPLRTIVLWKPPRQRQPVPKPGLSLHPKSLPLLSQSPNLRRKKLPHRWADFP